MTQFSKSVKLQLDYTHWNAWRLQFVRALRVTGCAQYIGEDCRRAVDWQLRELVGNLIFNDSTHCWIWCACLSSYVLLRLTAGECFFSFCSGMHLDDCSYHFSVFLHFFL